MAMDTEVRGSLLLSDGAESCSSESLEKMYSELRHRFEAIAYSILGNKEDAGDAVQDAFVSAYLNLRNFEGRSKLATWFTRIVVNSSLMLLRKRKMAHLRFVAESSDSIADSWIERIPEIGPDPEMIFAREETSRMIDELLGATSSLLGEAFRLRHFEGMSNKEGATKLGIPPTTFKSRVARAQRFLAQSMNSSRVASLPRPARMIRYQSTASVGNDAQTTA
jgi:RNA polymerase sigma-70 factor (ECF subfamily)